MTLKRVEQLRQSLANRQLEAIIIDSPINRKYISGFTGSAGTLFIAKDEVYLLTDFRYRTQSAEQAKGFNIIEYTAPAHEDVKKLIQKHGLTKVAFEQEHWTFAQYKQWEQLLTGIELVPTSSLVEQIRMIKDEQELQIIREAAHLADRTFAHILNYIKPGVKELDIALEMETFMRKNGATSSSFDTIVASGERSALPHGVASERIIGNEEFVKLDFGAFYKGYCSDITRTVYVGKNPSDKHLEIYHIVLEAQAFALENLKPGMTGKEGDALARDIITAKGYGDLFGHGLGHAIGMEIHEAPRLSRFSETLLTPGMVVTVEPGIYIPNFGGVRIEDDVVITQTGIQILTSSTKELIPL